LNYLLVNTGERIRALRLDRGISVRKLANQVGVSAVTIWKWEKGEAVPRRRSIGVLAVALGVSCNELSSPDRAASVRRPEARAVCAKPRVPRNAVPESPGTGARQTEGMADTIARAKQMIGKAAGTSEENITIRITY